MVIYYYWWPKQIRRKEIRCTTEMPAFEGTTKLTKIYLPNALNQVHDKNIVGSSVYTAAEN